MRPECIEAVSAAIGRELTTAETKKIEERILNAQARLWQKDRSAMLGLTKDQQLRLAAEQAAKDIKREAAKKQQRLALAIIAHDKNRTFLEHEPGLMQNNLQELLSGHKTVSVESLSESVRLQALASMVDEAEPFLPTNIGFDQGNTKMEAVYRELHGQETGDVAAKAYAKKLATLFESLRQRFNEAGGKIKWLDDWSHPQAHSAYLVFNAGQDLATRVRASKPLSHITGATITRFDRVSAWINDVAPKLDRSRYVNPDGSRFSDEQFNAFLNSTWDVLAYGGHANLEPGTGAHGGIRANAHSQTRELHFKDADSYLEYHKIYGEKSLHATLISHIDTLSRDIALVESMGPNPEHEFNYWNDYAYQDGMIQGHKAGSLNNTYIKNVRLFNEVAGINEPIGNQAAARWMDTMRSLNLISLGSSAVSTVTDLNTMMLTAQYNHLSQSKMMVEHLRALTDPESRRMARRLGIGLDTYAGTILRHGQEQLTNGLASKIGGAVIRLSGMPFITEANRQAFSITMMDALQHVVENHLNLEAVDKTDYRMMATHGIDEADFALWKQATPDLWHDGESKLLTPRSIMAIPDVEQAVLRKSADKLMALIWDEQNMAVSNPGAKERALMKAGTARGTLMGELARSFWQFKSFGLSYFGSNFRRIMSLGDESKQSSAIYAAQFFAQGLLFGVVSTQLKELINGRDPLAMNNMEFAGRALLASGGLGLFGDFLAAQNSRYGSSVVASMAGPTISKLEQVYRITWGNTLKAALGEKTHTKAETLGLVNSFNPLGMLWFTKAAFNHIVLQNLQESISPGYLRRMSQRAEREFKQQSYWRPGAMLPERAPHLLRAFGKE